ncbi:MAG: hypothetical protein AAF293_08545 [Pseudomonadota bacterium]
MTTNDILRSGMLWIKQSLSRAIRIEFSEPTDYPLTCIEWRNRDGKPIFLAGWVAHLLSPKGSTHNHWKLDTGRRLGAKVMGGKSGHYPVLDIDILTGATDAAPDNKNIPTVQWNNCYMVFRTVGKGLDADSALVFDHDGDVLRLDLDAMRDAGYLKPFESPDGAKMTVKRLYAHTEDISNEGV